MYTPAPRLTFLQKARVVWMAFLDRRTSFPAKMLLGAGVLYGVMPLDFIPDILPLIGFGDDAGIFLLTLFAFLRMTKAVRIALENDERYGNGASKP